MAGWIDIHSHLLPGIDDGCWDLEESFRCVRTLKDHGFVGSICTPHLWPQCYPENEPQRVRDWTATLQNELNDEGIEYTLWPGGELRLFEGAVDWMQDRGVPTLADSRCVLVDTWDGNWPAHIYHTIDWLIENNYQVILAHPERSAFGEGYDQALTSLIERGVWLQGNANPLTGADLPGSEQTGWRLIEAGRYTFLGLDMHGPDTLPTRLAGLGRVEQVLGRQTLQKLACDNPRQFILGQSAIER